MPTNAIATHYLGMATWQRGDVAEGERLMRASIAANASIPDFHNNLGLLLRDTKRTDEAIAGYRRALEVDPSWFEAYNNLGLALEDAGPLRRGDRGLRSGGREAARLRAARQNRARILLTMGRYAEGWAEYRWRLVAQGLARTPPEPTRQRLPASPCRAGASRSLPSKGIGDVLFFLRFARSSSARRDAFSFAVTRGCTACSLRTGLFAGGIPRPRPRTDRGSGDAIFVGDLPWLLEAERSFRVSRRRSRSSRCQSASNALRCASRRARPGAAHRAHLGARGPAMAGTGLGATEGNPPRPAREPRYTTGRRPWIGVQRFPRGREIEALASAMGAQVHDFSAANADLEEMLALLSLVDDYVGVEQREHAPARRAGRIDERARALSAGVALGPRGKSLALVCRHARAPPSAGRRLESRSGKPRLKRR
jgi:hypothetical protein